MLRRGRVGRCYPAQPAGTGDRPAARSDGVLRRRRPLALQLYVAARDELLIWRGPDSLALLQPPGGKRSPHAAPGWRLAVLRTLARQRDSVVLIVPALLLLGAAGIAALLVTAGGGRTVGLFRCAGRAWGRSCSSWC